ncbi:Aminoacyl-tRNA editing domain [endosymbiont of Ridgeia piscesae]|jgi:Ala-tRNA(Pro) deacylase|uniref:Aminoacyl-tRNA editing domain n=1 Tax=endosymbiont of Ridgeia piscesae TaxID=54398 RepID=A0A0T5Z699_9GAMM|nr:Aminoacyl-tRNA editing domain [endosymbiont of Ridgeia piscesae]KRT58455.1 Aminoacyl-tRNA editing domain-containing protein [endosymbiont of Ridgeia piscesae]
MAVIPGSNWVKLQALYDELNRKFELTEESEVNLPFKDCELSLIPPLGQAYGLETFLDQQLTTLANIYFEAGDHENHGA